MEVAADLHGLLHASPVLALKIFYPHSFVALVLDEMSLSLDMPKRVVEPGAELWVTI